MWFEFKWLKNFFFSHWKESEDYWIASENRKQYLCNAIKPIAQGIAKKDRNIESKTFTSLCDFHLYFALFEMLLASVTESRRLTSLKRKKRHFGPKSILSLEQIQCIWTFPLKMCWYSICFYLFFFAVCLSVQQWESIRVRSIRKTLSMPKINHRELHRSPLPCFNCAFFTLCTVVKLRLSGRRRIGWFSILMKIQLLTLCMSVQTNVVNASSSIAWNDFRSWKCCSHVELMKRRTFKSQLFKKKNFNWSERA